MTWPGRPGSLARRSLDLTELDLAILATINQHRFVTRRQVEALHFADRPSPLASARAANRIMKRLVELGFLATLARRVGGVRAGSASLVYYLARDSRRLMARRAGRPTPRASTEPSPAFVNHYLAVGDLHAELARASATCGVQLSQFDCEPSDWRTYLNAGGGRMTLKPDAFAVTVPRADADYEQVWFIEMDMGTESVPRVVRKCHQYQTYFLTGREQQAQGVFPLVLWVVPGDARARRITDAIAADWHLRTRLFRVATMANVVATQFAAGHTVATSDAGDGDARTLDVRGSTTENGVASNASRDDTAASEIGDAASARHGRLPSRSSSRSSRTATTWAKSATRAWPIRDVTNH